VTAKPSRAPVRVLVADDSVASREAFAAMLGGDPQIRVVAMARDGREAIEQAERHAPDVVLMDWLMPEVDGIAATREIMRRAPCPVLLCSSTPQVAGAALDAGAVDFIPKNISSAALCEAVKILSKVKVVGQRVGPRPSRHNDAAVSQCSVIGIAASTGGPPALREILSHISRSLPPIAIVQHLSDGFAPALAEWLGTTTRFPVEVARHGGVLRPGHAYLARDGAHLTIDRALGMEVAPAPLVNSVMPSADVLFRSLARCHGRRAIGVTLTGMGRDGASGMLELRRVGGRTIAQAAPSALIDGMPRAARELGAAEWIVPLDEIANALAMMAQGAAPLPDWLPSEPKERPD
jgi:two-component system, chemotaxis family, protein-glutamate methylesterase/glutaminase